MMYRLDLQTAEGIAVFEIHGVYLSDAKSAAVETAKNYFHDACSLTLRVAHCPDVVVRAESPRSPWVWLVRGRAITDVPEEAIRAFATDGPDLPRHPAFRLGPQAPRHD